jgi:hypothetical protein
MTPMWYEILNENIAGISVMTMTLAGITLSMKYSDLHLA